MKKSLLAILLIALASPAVFGQFAPPIDTVYTPDVAVPGASSSSSKRRRRRRRLSLFVV